MTVMSSTIEGTAQTGAAHRDTSPVWPFHLLLARIGWAFAWVYWAANDVEARAVGKPRTTITIVLAAVALIMTAAINLAVHA